MVDIPPQIKWGKENEARAREAYIAKMSSLRHRGIECQPCGLTLMPEHSYLGASGDRIIKKELVSEIGQICTNMNDVR